MKKWKVNLKLSKMKEQDLRDKFDDCVIINHVGIDTDQCVQIAKDYAEQEAIEFSEWTCGRYIKLHNVWVGIYADQRNKENWKSTSELYQLFKNRENER